MTPRKEEKNMTKLEIAKAIVEASGVKSNEAREKKGERQMKVEELKDRAEKEGIINSEGKHFKVKVTHVKFTNKFDRKVDYFVLKPINDDEMLFKYEWRSYWHLHGVSPWWLASEEEEFKKSQSLWHKYAEKEMRA